MRRSSSRETSLSIGSSPQRTSNVNSPGISREEPLERVRQPLDPDRGQVPAEPRRRPLPSSSRRWMPASSSSQGPLRPACSACDREDVRRAALVGDALGLVLVELLRRDDGVERVHTRTIDRRSACDGAADLLLDADRPDAEGARSPAAGRRRCRRGRASPPPSARRGTAAGPARPSRRPSGARAASRTPARRLPSVLRMSACRLRPT